jgi:DNA-binding winged helix-turn-helix (wHTH) protein
VQETDRLFAFGPFELNVACCELLREGVPVAIHATPLRLLVYLVERRERNVSKQELLDRVWPDSYVSENALTSAICAIRRALSADGAPRSWIRTERGRGYRFVADVEERPALGAAHPATAVAVLPFADMSPRGDQEHLADGLTEELIHALSQDGHLQVVARTSVFAFKGRQEDVRGIGAQLDAGSVVEPRDGAADPRRGRIPPLVGELRPDARRRPGARGRDRAADWRRDREPTQPRSVSHRDIREQRRSRCGGLASGGAKGSPRATR